MDLLICRRESTRNGGKKKKKKKTRKVPRWAALLSSLQTFISGDAVLPPSPTLPVPPHLRRRRRTAAQGRQASTGMVVVMVATATRWPGGGTPARARQPASSKGPCRVAAEPERKAATPRFGTRPWRRNISNFDLLCMCFDWTHLTSAWISGFLCG